MGKTTAKHLCFCLRCEAHCIEMYIIQHNTYIGACVATSLLAADALNIIKTLLQNFYIIVRAPLTDSFSNQNDWVFETRWSWCMQKFWITRGCVNDFIFVWTITLAITKCLSTLSWLLSPFLSERQCVGGGFTSCLTSHGSEKQQKGVMWTVLLLLQTNRQEELLTLIRQKF